MLKRYYSLLNKIIISLAVTQSSIASAQELSVDLQQDATQGNASQTRQAESSISGEIQRRNTDSSDSSNTQNPAVEAVVILFKHQACLDFMNNHFETEKYKFRWSDPTYKNIGLFEDSEQQIVGCGQISLPIDTGQAKPHPEFHQVIINNQTDPGILDEVSKQLTKSVTDILSTTYDDFESVRRSCEIYNKKVVNNKEIKNKFIKTFGNYMPEFPASGLIDSITLGEYKSRLQQIEDMIRQSKCKTDKFYWAELLGSASVLNLSKLSGGPGGRGPGLLMASDYPQQFGDSARSASLQDLEDLSLVATQKALAAQAGSGASAVSTGGVNSGAPSTSGGSVDRSASIDGCPADDPECDTQNENCPPDDPDCVLQEIGEGQLEECIANLLEDCIPAVFNEYAYAYSNLSIYSGQRGLIYRLPNPGGDISGGMVTRCVSSNSCDSYYNAWSLYDTTRYNVINNKLKQNGPYVGPVSGVQVQGNQPEIEKGQLWVP